MGNYICVVACVGIITIFTIVNCVAHFFTSSRSYFLFVIVRNFIGIVTFVGISAITSENCISHFGTAWRNYSFFVDMLFVFCIISNIGGSAIGALIYSIAVFFTSRLYNLLIIIVFCLIGIIACVGVATFTSINCKSKSGTAWSCYISLVIVRELICVISVKFIVAIYTIIMSMSHTYTSGLCNFSFVFVFCLICEICSIGISAITSKHGISHCFTSRSNYGF